MRRLIANSVLLVILAIFFAPALTGVASTPVPLCCRRGGMHHCAMMAEMLQMHGTSVSTENPCPMRQTAKIGPCSVGLPVSAFSHFEAHPQWLLAAGLRDADFAPTPAGIQRGPPSYSL